MSTVRSWPSYVLHRRGGLPAELRAALSADARSNDQSLADTIRGILCAHYSLDCPPRGSGYDEGKDEGAPMLVVRMQPELFQALREDAEEREESLRHLIIEILEAHYQSVTKGTRDDRVPRTSEEQRR